MWLDDIRPAPDGWTHVTSVAQAKVYLKQGCVEIASLDHDLGACEECLGGRTAVQWLYESNYESMPNCQHVGSGYDLCCWMEETGHWPKGKPNVHSANPVGRAKMEMAINRHYGTTR